MALSESSRIDKKRSGVEMPTLILAIIIHGAWLLATWLSSSMPAVVSIAIGGWLVAWHGSLQHETIHGHPTRWPAINMLIGSLPLALWLPYRCYRRDHAVHHATPHVTDPLFDPESRYLMARNGRAGRVRIIAAKLQSTLIGRLLFGPPIVVAGFLLGEAIRLVRSPAATLRDWMPHAIGLALVAWWLRICGIGLGEYLALFVYPGTTLTLLRSFAEHRAAPLPGHRIAVVERAGLLALLFLNNNLHAVHHRAPGLPWYALPRLYRTHRREILRENGGLLYRGYGEILRRYAWHRHDASIHPDHASVVQ